MITRSPHKRADRTIEIDLHEAGLAGRDGAGAEHREPADPVLGAEMEMHRQPVAQRRRRGARHGDGEIDAADRLVQRRVDDPVAAAGLGAFGNAAGQVQGAALALPGMLHGAVMGMDAAHPQLDTARAEAHPVADRDRAGRGGAGHHEPDAGQREGAVDRQPEAARYRAGGARASAARALSRKCSASAGMPSPPRLDTG